MSAEEPGNSENSPDNSPPGEGAEAAEGNGPESKRVAQQAAEMDVETRVTTPVGNGKSKIIQSKEEDSKSDGATLKIYKS